MRRPLATVSAVLFAAPVLGQGFRTVSIQVNAPKQSSTAVPTLRANAQLVVVDVVVLDKNKQPVHGLKAEDFTLLEGGTPQAFKSFEEHVAPTAADAAKLTAPAKLPAGIFSNFAPALANGPLNILLLDRLNTPIANQAEMQVQINEFLATARPGQRMAIFGLTDHLMLLQGFTDDPQLLRAAVVQGGYSTSPLRDDKIGELGNSESQKPSDIAADALAASGLSGREAAGMVGMLKKFETLNTAAQTQLRVQFSLDALNALARYLAAFPGRKNLIWFSGSFPVDILPDLNKNNSLDAFDGVASKNKEFQETIALLSRNQVAVYPIDARGIASDPSVSAANIATSSGLNGRPAVGGTTLENMITTGEKQDDERAMMYAMADKTGGKAAVNTNGLRQAVEDAITNGSNYYTIAYSPSNANGNGAFRSIQVKLKEQGYNLSYRKGYFADDTDALGGAKGGVASAGNSASHAMALALTHGGPTPTQLMFTARVLPVSAATEEKLAPGNKAGSGDKAPYRRYRVDFAIDPRAISFNLTPDGNRHAVLEFVTHVYDAEGNLVDSIGSSINANVIPAAYAQFQQSGVPYHQEVSVPAKGEYFLRIAMRDAGADHVGAIELPVASVRDLPPVEAAVAAPGSVAK